MKKAALIKEATLLLRNNNIRKPVSIPKHRFHITDDDGNQKDFTIKQLDKQVIYTTDDVERILDACLQVIKDSLKRGEPVSVYGFGTLGVQYRKGRISKNVLDGSLVDMPGRYLPKFSFGHELRMCAKAYEMFLKDKVVDAELLETDSVEAEDSYGS